MANRLVSREIPLFWTFEELGPLRKQIEDWYSKGVPLSGIMKRASSVREKEGKRSLICCDVYGVLMDAVRRNTLVQRAPREDEMPIATFFHFFACWKKGGSLAECTEKVSVSIPAAIAGQPPSPKFLNQDTCKKLHRQMSERYRAEERGDVQAFIKPKKEALAARPNMTAAIHHEVALRIAQRCYDLVMQELKAGPPLDAEAAAKAEVLPPPIPMPAPLPTTLGESPINEEDEQTEDDDEKEELTLDNLADEEDATPLHPIHEVTQSVPPALPPLVNGQYENPFEQ